MDSESAELLDNHRYAPQSLPLAFLTWSLELAACKTLAFFLERIAAIPHAIDAAWAPKRRRERLNASTLHRLRHRDGHRRRRVRAGHLQARRLDRELVLDDRLTPLRRDSGLLEDRRLQGRGLQGCKP